METENAAAAAAAAFTASSQLKEAVLGREPAFPLRAPAGWLSRQRGAACWLLPQVQRGWCRLRPQGRPRCGLAGVCRGSSASPCGGPKPQCL